MSAETLMGAIGALFVAPFVWSAVVALARRGDTPLSDAHEKAILAVMLAPILVASVVLALPRETVSAAIPPLLDWAEFPAFTGGKPSLVAQRPVIIDWALLIGWGLIALYLLGAARFGLPLMLAHIRLSRWSAAAAPHSEISSLYVSDVVATPLAIARGRVLFPHALLDVLSAEQVQLIVDHERRHHARGDVGFYAVLAWIEVLTWFNPFVRAQVRRCRLAAELDCDAAVTASAPQSRKIYAETLLLVLKHSAGRALACAPAVFSNMPGGEHRMRILKIMKSEDGARGHAPWLAYAMALALVVPIGAAQLAMAQAGNTGEFILAAPTPVSATEQERQSQFEFDRSTFSHRPLEGRLTSGFGQRTDALSGELAFHAGGRHRRADGRADRSAC